MNVAVCMSGGVDSSVAAFLLKEQGHEVVGITMALWDGAGRAVKRHACYGPDEEEDIESARAVCRLLGMPHHVFDCSRRYKSIVLDHFRSEYLTGRTPNPCVLCNQTMKFGVLPETARKAGLAFERLASGHYARIGRDENSGRFFIKKAVDGRKDQSYFLYRLSQEQLADVLFPLGELSKDEVRSIARANGLPVSERPESQDFYGGDLKDLLRAKESLGTILSSDGRVLGTHGGIWNYTIGQRKGIGISCGEPLYVVGIDKTSNSIVVGPKKDLGKRAFIATGISWMAIDTLSGVLDARVKIRSTHDEKPAVLESGEKDAITVTFDAPVDSIAPGQSSVFYRDDVVLGGGIIAEVK